jgi:peptidoglycan-N-acetylglucosamine deacetylase
MTSDGQLVAGPNLALTFDVDGFSNWIGSLGAVSPGPLSRGEFEHIGLGRVLALLDEYCVRATFFIPGSTAVSFPDAVRAIANAGHEIAHHGWVHEPLTRLTTDRERAVLVRGRDELERVTGVRAVGYRSPGWDMNPTTVELLLEHGFEYDSSLMGADHTPYWCRVGDRASPEDGFSWGRPTRLVEMPVAWHLDDHPFFEHIEAPGVFNMGLRPPSSVLEIWTGEFDYMADSLGSGVMVLTLHPQVIGRGHRLAMLRRFLDHVVGRGDARFTTCLQYARAWREGREPSLPSGATDTKRPTSGA